MPPWLRRITTKADDLPVVNDNRILRASFVQETYGDEGKTRFVMAAAAEAAPEEYLLIRNGLEAVEVGGIWSRANHRRQIESGGGRLHPYGVISLDSEAVRLLSGESADVDTLLADPNIKMGAGTAERVGIPKEIGLWIVSIECPEAMEEIWKVLRKDALLWGKIDGTLWLISRKSGKWVSERVPNTDKFLRRIFENGLQAERERRRAAAKARWQAKHAVSAD